MPLKATPHSPLPIPDSAVHNTCHSTHAAGPDDWLSSAPDWLKATGIPDVSAARCKEPPSPRPPCPARQGAVFKFTRLYGCTPSGAGGRAPAPAPAQWNRKQCAATAGKQCDSVCCVVCCVWRVVCCVPCAVCRVTCAVCCVLRLGKNTTHNTTQRNTAPHNTQYNTT
jgi:hypothetical protein